MDLLDRYLQAVRFFLPRRHQDDIVRELSENLISQMEDREEELGRPLSEEERAEILRRHGHPMLVAGRYRQHQQLIGPVFFPIYAFALKIGLGAALAVTLVLAVAAVVLHGDPIGEAVGAMLAYPGRALMVFAWTTLGFAAVDMAAARLPLTANWDPRTLPKVIRHEHAIPRWRTMCELAFLIPALIWLLLVPRAPFLLLGPAAALVDPAPIWWVVYLPIVMLTIATAALHAVNFSRPYWTRARSLARLGIQAATLFVFVILLRAGDSFTAAHSATLAGGPEADVINIINMSFQIGFVVVIAVSAVEIARELYRLRHLGRTPRHEPADTLAG